MSYRCKVRIATTQDGYETIATFVDANTEPGTTPIIGKSVVPECLEMYKNTCIFGWDYISWYSVSPWTTSIQDALKKLEKEKIPYQLVVVGEDGDTEDYWSEDASVETLDAFIVTETVFDILHNN